MSNRDNEQLDRLLAEFYDKAEPEQTYTFDLDSVKRSSPVPFPISRRIMAAAGLVLVSALSVSLFLTFGGHSPAPPIAPSSQNAITPSQNESAPRSDETTKNDSTEAEKTEVAASTDAARTSSDPTEKTAATETASPVPTQSRDLTPTQAQATQSSATSAPTQAPTQYSQPATQAPVPTPTQQATQAPTQTATLPPKPQWPSENHSSGDPGASPGEGLSSQYKVKAITDSFDLSLLTGGYSVYCRILTEDGELLGDSDLYSGAHRARIDTVSGSRVYIVYRPDDLGFEPDSQEYRYEFYDKNGGLLCSGTATLI